MELFLVRHGQSEPTSATPDWDLSMQGEHEARCVGERLSSTGVTHILSSPLLRALATAQIIAETLDHQPIEVWLDLREGFDDDYHGSSRTVLLSRFPRVILPASLPTAGWTYPGDTHDLFVARCRTVLARLKARFGVEDRVVLVTHGGFMNYLLHAVAHIPIHAPVWFEMANGALTHLRFVRDQDQKAWPLYPAFEVEILTLNDTTHLV